MVGYRNEPMVLTIIETVKWTKRESGLRAAGSVGVVELAESLALAVAQHDEFESVKVTFHVADNAANLHGRRNFQGDDFAGQELICQGSGQAAFAELTAATANGDFAGVAA